MTDRDEAYYDRVLYAVSEAVKSASAASDGEVWIDPNIVIRCFISGIAWTAASFTPDQVDTREHAHKFVMQVARALENVLEQGQSANRHLDS